MKVPSKTRRADAINPSTVFWAYAALVWLAGLSAIIWTGPSGQPWAPSLTRIIGSLLMAAGCFAAALARMDEKHSSAEALYWFAGGHAIVFWAVQSQRSVFGAQGPAQLAAGALLTTTVAFFYLAYSAEGEHIWDRRPEDQKLLSLFGRAAQGSSTERLRSRYEQQIRAAASQEERNRLARNLHDSIKQQIFAIQTGAATAQIRFEEDPAGARLALDQIRSSAREAMTEMEAMLYQLRAAPLENVGLIEALKKQCEALSFRTGARVQFKPGDLPPIESLVPGTPDAIFRVAQEALANVSRHSRAKNIQVSLGAVKGSLRLSVEDDGAGFDLNQGSRGMGLANMRERAEEFGGELDVQSQPDSGTCLIFSVPYSVDEPSKYRRRMFMWGFNACVMVIFLLGNNSFSITLIAFTVISMIGLVREAMAWRRSRKERGYE